MPISARSHRLQFSGRYLLPAEGGRWGATSCWLVRHLAEARSHIVRPRLQAAAARAWEARWWGMLSVAVQNALAATLVDDR